MVASGTIHYPLSRLDPVSATWLLSVYTNQPTKLVEPTNKENRPTRCKKLVSSQLVDLSVCIVEISVDSWQAGCWIVQTNCCGLPLLLLLLQSPCLTNVKE